MEHGRQQTHQARPFSGDAQHEETKSPCRRQVILVDSDGTKHTSSTRGADCCRRMKEEIRSREEGEGEREGAEGERRRRESNKMRDTGIRCGAHAHSDTPTATWVEYHRLEHVHPDAG